MPTKNKYILMFSIHGLLRYNDMELGRDADTGGQIKYVVEMAEALSKQKGVRRVDLFTRLIADKRVSEDYAEPVETVSNSFRIIRIRCGGKKYMRKELLWPHLDEYIDRTIRFIKQEGVYPDIVHGHYPDAGYVGIALSEYFGTPFVYTGHSLGRSKKERLMNEGMSAQEINKKLFIERRISAEEEIIKNADLIITSTNQEVETQYGAYRNHHLADYCVIPPGINLDKFYPYHRNLMRNVVEDEEFMIARGSIQEELNRFFMTPDRPLILALCRADKRKNISGLIHAYGSDKELKTMANLAIFAGIRRNISEMEENEKDVLTEMLMLMDQYDLYGKMAIPKKHDFSHEVPELYRMAGERKGVFVNVALTEPFGLTLIEAASCGVPIVATNDGGPRDIIKNCENGLLVDPLDTEAITGAIKEIIIDPEKWKQFSQNGIKGVQTHYNWEAHVKKYLERIGGFRNVGGASVFKKSARNPIAERLMGLEYLLITDIDNTLLGDDDALDRLMEKLSGRRDRIGFGVASGRSIDSIVKLFDETDIMAPDVIVASVGAEIYYRESSFPDKGWQTHIAKWWQRDRIKAILDEFSFLEYQEEPNQRPFKISYYMPEGDDYLERINKRLNEERCHVNVIYSHGQFLDILPHRASKGKAVRYLGYKWEIPLNQIIVSGDSGNDEEMLKGSTLAIVVGNYASELAPLKGKRNIYFADDTYADGMIEGLKHYSILEK